jgi:hypothetical protein
MSQPVHAAHADRRFVQHIAAPPAAVFPLLCPEREKEWIPGWEARTIHSRSGLSEDGALFATPHAGGETLWYTVTHRPDQEVRFVRLQPDGVLVDIQITLAPEGEQHSLVHVRYRHTATRTEGRAAVEAFTDTAWQEMMRRWQGLMNQWFAIHRGR